MKRYIRSTEDIFAMSKILEKYAIDSIASDVGKFIYFSESNSSHSPRIKFYGGSVETSSTRNAPSLAFDSEGECVLELADWMNKQNCPNAYDAEYLAHLENFVKNNKSILLLVWFRHLDEGDALAYFHGQISFLELLDDIDVDIDEPIANATELDKFCKLHQLYAF